VAIDNLSEDFCPDILGQITKSDKRFEYKGIQFVGGIYPREIAAGERTYIFFILQNTLDVPVDFKVKVEVPETILLFMKTHLKSIKEVVVRIGPAEVGELRIPIQTSLETPDFEYEIKITIDSKPLGKGKRIRPKEYSKTISTIAKYVAINIATMPLGLKVVPSRNEFNVKLIVTKEKRSTQYGELRYEYTSLWTEDDWRVWREAKRLLRERYEQILKIFDSPAVLNALKQSILSFFHERGVSDLHESEAFFIAIAIHESLKIIANIDEEEREELFLPVLEKAVKNNYEIDNIAGIFTEYIDKNTLKFLTYAYIVSYARLTSESKRKSSEKESVVKDIVSRLGAKQSIDFDHIYYPLIVPFGILYASKRLRKEELQQHINNLVELKKKRSNQLSRSVSQFLDFAINEVLST